MIKQLTHNQTNKTNEAATTSKEKKKKKERKNKKRETKIYQVITGRGSSRFLWAN